MSTPKSVIRVPKPPAGSFNKDRAAPKHLQAQVEHLADAIRKHLRDEVKTIKTEGDAANYIKKLTEILRLLSPED